MATPPFKVKAIFDYSSPHDDDLSFANGQIISVTEEEDADWYVGEYTDSSGTHQSGLFPKNFVEKYEPEIPSRPTRPTRPKGTVQSAPTQLEPKDEPTETEDTEVEALPPPPPTLKPIENPEKVTAAAPITPEKRMEVEKPSAPSTAPSSARVDNREAPAKGAPPAVSEKPSSFKDRIAAFNKTQSSPVAPLKPSSGASNYAIKKPFVAPPPARSAYIPPIQKQEPVQKVYRREEDPEIAERLAQDQAAADAVGLGASQQETAEEGEEAPKPQSLKERIAALQKQQAEQAQRRADTTTKEKPKRPAKKRTESADQVTAEEPEEEDADHSRPVRASEDSAQQPLSRTGTRTLSPAPKPAPTRPAIAQESDIFSDGNEADQSAAGELTEGNEDTSDQEDAISERLSIDAVKPPRAAAAPVQEPDVGDEEGSTEGQTEEDEVDAETRRKLELRERMAKISGGMGMAGMFGPQPGMAVAPPPTRKSTKSRERRQSDDKPNPPPAPRQMVPVPGMLPSQPKMRDEPEVETDEDDAPSTSITKGTDPDQVQDIEDIRAKPVSVDESSEARSVPPIPGGRAVPIPPTASSRPQPQALPPRPDDANDSETTLPDRPLVETPRAEVQPARGAPPPVPSNRTSMDSSKSPPIPSMPPVSYFPDDAGSEGSMPLRNSRKPSRAAPPPVPGTGPLASPSLGGRGAPPPLPPGAPPARNEDTEERESEYEGDYDTDIASGDKHKAALKSHPRRQSTDEGTTDDQSTPEPSALQAVSPPATYRSVPPPPPPAAQTQRMSTDMPRAAPPPLPPSPAPVADEDDEETGEGLDNYKRFHEASRPAPPPPTGMSPPSLPMRGSADPPVPPLPSRQTADESDDELYAAPTRRSTEPPRAMPPPPPSEPSPRITDTSRKSLDANKALSRKSTEIGRPFGDGYIATIIDGVDDTQWWSQEDTLPPVLQNRRDILCEIEESSTSKRGGKTTVSKDVYVLYHDYSQTVITAVYDPANPSEVDIDQRHEAPPARLRQDQLESSWQSFGARIAEKATVLSNSSGSGGGSSKKDSSSGLGDGSAHALAAELISALPSALPPVGSRSYGALVYANIGNASVQQFDEIRPGDMITFRNAKLQGKHGGLHQRYSQDVGGISGGGQQGQQGHVAVVTEWDGTKKKVRAVEQVKDDKGRVKTKVESYRLGDLKSGEVKVWRVVGREWVGWGSGPAR